MTSTIGIPIKLLNESTVCAILDELVFTARANAILQGHIVTVEITSGQVYRGKLIEGPQSTARVSGGMLMVR